MPTILISIVKHCDVSLMIPINEHYLSQLHLKLTYMYNRPIFFITLPKDLICMNSN